DVRVPAARTLFPIPLLPPGFLPPQPLPLQLLPLAPFLLLPLPPPRPLLLPPPPLLDNMLVRLLPHLPPHILGVLVVVHHLQLAALARLARPRVRVDRLPVDRLPEGGPFVVGHGVEERLAEGCVGRG